MSSARTGDATTDATGAAVLAGTLALARIPAPTGAEDDRLAWLEHRLQGSGGQLRRDDAGNLRWTFGTPPFALMLLVHVDTVFDASVDHVPTVRDGWLHGPGVGDNIVAVVTAVEVVERLRASDNAPLAVVFTVGEEGLGSLRGARHACAMVTADIVIALEGHGLDAVCTDAVGCLRVQVTVSGPGGHSWWDRGRPSATHELVRLLGRLMDGSPPGLALNVGRIRGGTAVNAIAARAEALVEGRSLDEQLIATMTARLEETAALGRLDVAVQVLDRRPAGRIDPAHPLVTAVLTEREALGLPGTLADGSTDANAALAAGIPALALGCTRGADMHSPQERVEIASIARGAAQLERVLRRLLARDRQPMTTTR